MTLKTTNLLINHNYFVIKKTRWDYRQKSTKLDPRLGLGPNPFHKGEPCCPAVGKISIG